MYTDHLHIIQEYIKDNLLKFLDIVWDFFCNIYARYCANISVIKDQNKFDLYPD